VGLFHSPDDRLVERLAGERPPDPHRFDPAAADRGGIAVGAADGADGNGRESDTTDGDITGALAALREAL
jgi:hypothetical protein